MATIELDEETLSTVDAIAARTGETRGEVIRRLTAEYLAENGQQPPKATE